MLRHLAVLSSLALLAGCLNLDLPDTASLSSDGGNGKGPSVSNNSLIGQQVGSASQVSFDVQDVDGVARVTLSCSGIDLITWTEPPYSATVNFAPCQVVGTPSDAGSGFVDVTLTLTAIDTLGNPSQTTFTVTLDTNTASIATDLPDRVRPGQPLDFHVTVDRPIRGTPTVKLGTLVPTVSPTADPLTFDVHLAQMPLLGVDGYTGTQPPPASVLEDVERSLDTIIDVVAQNGNSSRLQRTVLLSRVIWDRPLPAPLLNQAGPFPVAAPTVTATGFTVPLLTSLIAGQQGYTWLPAVYGQDGSLTTAAALGDGGVFAQAIDADGWVAAMEPSQTLDYFDPLSPATPIASPVPLPQLLARVGSLLCGAGSTPDGTAPMPIVCTGHDGSVVNADGPPLVTYGSYADPPFTAGSGKAFLLTAATDYFNTTRSTWVVGEPETGTLTAEPFFDGGSGYSGCVRNAFTVLPTGAGAFVIFDRVDCTSPTGAKQVGVAQEAVLIGPDGAHLGSYAVSPGQQSAVVVTALSDDRVVTLTPGTPDSTLSLYPPDGGGSADVPVPGFYEYPPSVGVNDGGVPAPRDAVASPRGLAILTATSSFTRALIQLDGNEDPRWIYRYPRTAQADSLHVYAAPGSPLVYLVDTYNQRVLAIEP